jgi:hypothetical protein
LQEEVSVTAEGEGEVEVTFASGGNTLGTSIGSLPIVNMFAGAANNGTTQVADAAKGVTLNLAWLLFLLPFAFMYIIKRKFAAIRDMVAKGVHLLL